MPNIFETTDAAANTSTAYTLPIGQVARGSIGSLGDHDWYKVNLVAGQAYTVALVGTGTAGVVDPILSVYGADGSTVVASNDDGLPNNNSVVTFTANSTGTYYIDAGAYGNNGTGQYGVSIAAGTRATTDVEMGAGIIDAYGSGNEYSWSATPGTGATVTVGFRMTNDNAQPNFSQFTPQQMAAVQTILQYYSDVCNINFTIVNPGGYTDNATILLSNYNNSDNSGGYAQYPGSTASNATAGDVHINIAGGNSTSSLPWGSYSFYTLMHEIGHAVGLTHPGLYNAAPGVTITYAANAQFIQDTQQYTVMSYFDESNTTGSWGIYPETLMMYDIYALQQIYGANYATRSGNSVYGFNSNVGGDFDFSTNSNPALCIWDGGGTDTLNCSGFSQIQTINLNDGSFSNVGGFTGNVSIAINAIIENAVGGSGGDTIIGNAIANRITGGAGRDNMTGNGGADTFVFALGDSSPTSGQHDLITDFTSSDFIDISAMGTFHFLGTSAFDGKANALDYFYNSSSGVTTLQGDINGDKIADFAIDLTGNMTLSVANIVGATSVTKTAQDFNADAKADLLWTNGSGTYSEWQSTGNSFTPNVFTFQVSSGWHPEGTFDFNGDGRADILWRNDTTGAFTIWNSTGSGFAANAYGNSGVSNAWTVAAMRDFNGDGLDDIVFRNVTGGTFSVWQSTGTGFTPNVFVGGVDNTWHLSAAADFNGDGKNDLLWRNDNGTFTEWQSNGNGFTPNVYAGSVSPAWHVLGTGDFNGDGKADLLFRNDNGSWTEWQSTGNGFTANVYANSGVSNAWQLAQIGDFNADGKDDLLWRNGDTFTEWQSTGNSFTPNVMIGNVASNWSLITHHYDLV